MFRYASYVVANLLRNRRRTALTALSIAVGLCLLTVLTAGYVVLFQEQGATPAEALRLMTHHKISITQPMPVSFEDRIRQIPGVRDVMVWQWFGGTYRDRRDPRNFFARFAVEPARLFHIRSEMDLAPETKAEFERRRTACIVGRKLAERMGWSAGDRVTLVGDIYPVTLELTIAGIFSDPNHDDTLYFNYEYLRELIRAAGAGRDEVGVFQVQAASVDDVSAVADAIDKMFENSPAPTKTETERAWELSFISFLGDLKLFLIAISAALSFTVLLVCANTVSMAVRERFREVGILKTLGFTPGRIAALTIAESTCIALLGGLMGLALATLLCIAVRHSGTAYAALKLAIGAEAGLMCLCAAVVLGVASSTVPAWRAAQTRILDSLRNVE